MTALAAGKRDQHGHAMARKCVGICCKLAVVGWLLHSSTAGSLKNSGETSLELATQSGDKTHVLAHIVSSFRSVVRKASAAIGALLVLAENAFLRQQLIVAKRSIKRPKVRRHERGLLALIAAFNPRWHHALLIVQPKTLIRWHLGGFHLFWGHASRPASRKHGLAAMSWR